MDHQGQLQFDSPAHLLLEGFELLVLELTAPIEVETYLANGFDTRGMWKVEGGMWKVECGMWKVLADMG